MTSTAAHLVDTVLPPLPYRQWVLSVPRRMRMRMRILLATSHDLLSAVLNMAIRTIFAWQKRRARRLGVAFPMCGAIAFVRRFGSLLNLHCHYHNVLPDEVSVENDAGDVDFRPILPPTKADVEKLVEQIARGTSWTDGPANRRQASHYGYSLHAERIVDADDRDGLEKLCRYASRAPISMSGLSLDRNGQVIAWPSLGWDGSPK